MNELGMVDLSAAQQATKLRELPVNDDEIELTTHPAGYRILVEIKPNDETQKRWMDKTIVMPPDVREREWQAQVVAKVLALGPRAYRDRRRFGWRMRPWCKAGDWIMIPPYSGRRFWTRDRLYALINDDTPLAVVDDISEMERV